MNKRAQFFIIAALILSGIILTVGKVYTSSKIEKENVKVYDLSSEIQYEASQVVDNGLYNQDSPDKIKDNIKNLTAYYAKLNPDSNIDIIFGNSSNISLIEYNLSSNQIIESSIPLNSFISSASSSDTSFEVKNNELKVQIQTQDAASTNKTVEHSLLLDNSQVFYIVLRKKTKDQDVIIYR